MTYFIKGYSAKQIGLLLLIVAVFSGASYFIYDKYFAKKMMIASIEPYNFTGTSIVDLFVNGRWGGNSRAHSGGSRSVCCVLIPKKWRPGLVANIKWQKTEDPTWYAAQAPIPEYTESGALQVLFIKNNQVKVYVMDYWSCSADHPMPKDELCTEKKQP